MTKEEKLIGSTADEDERYPKNRMCITCVLPILVFVLAYILFPLTQYGSILGDRVDFTDCTVSQIDPVSG